MSFPAVDALCGPLPAPRSLALRTLKAPWTGEALDQGLVALFPAPNSFTGEDCAELQVHGSPAGVKAILAALAAMEGISLAGPGDFTRRAFENGKLDLTAVDGLGDLLAAETEAQRKQALQRLEGGLAARILDWREGLLGARAEIEAHLDFSDEDDVPFELPAEFAANLDLLRVDIENALMGYANGRIVREGFRIVLAGAPNAGKSSLLNALSGSDLAIVTPEAGTTRDIRDVSIDLGGQLVILTDTAGLRDTDSLAEAEGIRRARLALERADLVLWLLAPEGLAEASADGSEIPLWTIGTKADLSAPRIETDFQISTVTGLGLDILLNALKAHIEARIGGSEPSLVSHLRDKDALESAVGHLVMATERLSEPELCAEELRLASDRLAGLIGLIDSEAVLDRLFAGFCIGK